MADETAAQCRIIAPTHHWLSRGVIFKLKAAASIWFNRPFLRCTIRVDGASVLAWSGQATDWSTFLRQTHQAGYTADAMYTDSNWNTAVHNGFIGLMPESNLHLPTQGVH